MTPYEELCGAYPAWETRQSRWKKIGTMLPTTFRDGLHVFLKAPTSELKSQTTSPGPYVDLYVRSGDQNGAWDWDRAVTSNVAQQDQEGAWCFIVGVTIEPVPGRLPRATLMIRCRLIDAAETAHLTIDGASNIFKIDPEDEGTFSLAYELITAKLLAFMRSPTGASPNGSLGFEIITK